jgi:nucleoside-diphosphate-sugar epimerase
MRILVTGASGFLGSALARHFVDDGHEVALLLRPASSLGRLAGREPLFRIGRCASDAEVREFVGSVIPDAVFHTACIYGRHGETALDLLDVNVRLGVMIMDAVLARESNAPCTFFNTGTVLAPGVSTYALSKQQFSQWGQMQAQRTCPRIRFINIRLQHMYGAGDDPTKFTTHVLHACHLNRAKLDLTAGEQARDFIYIDDVVSAYATLLERRDDLAWSEDIDVGSGQAPTIRQFVETVHRLTGSSTALQFGVLPYRPNEAMHCKADTTRMRALGWHPRFDLETGLRQTLRLEFAE